MSTLASSLIKLKKGFIAFLHAVPKRQNRFTENEIGFSLIKVWPRIYLVPGVPYKPGLF